MLQIEEALAAEQKQFRVIDAYNDLLKEWLYNLTFEEKMIWLWNAKVEMLRIKQRRR